ncbi:MAG: hypothetical protein HY738_18740 [Bacteroidia bacterium]|nr:hypothetical protein [Bacteroidia bacterium]
MKSQLKEFAQNIRKMSMNEQEEKLELIFDEWKGEKNQIDDVLIIGIRF